MQESRMGGIEHNSLELARALKRRGVVVAFLIPGQGALSRLLEEEGLAYEVVGHPPFFSTSFRFGSRYLFNPFATLYDFIIVCFLAVRIPGWLVRHRPSLVVTKGLLANFYGSLASRLAGVPVIWDMQEIVSRTKAFGFVRWILNQWARFFPSHITVGAESIGAQFGKTLQKKITVIPNGVSLERFHPHVDSTLFRKELGIGAGVPLIGHAARYTYWKGQLEFVKAASEIIKTRPDVRFVSVGAPVFEDDTYEKQVKQLAKDLQLENQIFFRGYRKDFEHVLAALDIFVHSSIEPEGCPLTLISAMAMEKAVIATRVPGSSEIIQDGVNGILVEPRNSSDLARTILHLLETPNRRNELGRAARLRVLEKFSLDQFATKTLAVMEPLQKAVA